MFVSMFGHNVGCFQDRLPDFINAECVTGEM